MTVTNTLGVGVSTDVFQFLGYRDGGAEPFPYEIDKFLIKPWQGETVEEFLTKPQELFETLYNFAASVRNILAYDKCPADLLRYIDLNLSIENRDFRDLDSLPEADHRRLISVMASVWKYAGTPSGYYEGIKGFSRKDFKVLQWPYWKLVLDETYLAYEEVGFDAWLLDVEGPTPDTYWTHIRIVDPGFRTLNRNLIEDLVKVASVAAELITIRWLYFLDLCRHDEQFIVDSGTLSVTDDITKFTLVNGTTISNDVNYSLLWNNYAVEYRCKVGHSGVLTTALSKPVFFAYFNDYNNNYYLQLDHAAGLVRLGKTVAGVGATLATYTPTTFFEDTYYTWKIEISDKTFKVYQDHESLGVHVEGTLSFSSGGIALQLPPDGASDSALVVDEIEVYKIIEETVDSSSAEYNKELVSRIAQDVLASPGVFTVATTGTQAVIMFGGFSGYSVSANSGTVSVPALNSDGVYSTTYTAPGSPGSDTLTVQDQFGNSTTVNITIV